MSNIGNLMKRFWIVTVGTSICVACASSRTGNDTPDVVRTPNAANAFYMIFGADTLTTERFSRTPERIEGSHLDRVRGMRLDYVVTLAPDARISRIDATRTARGAAPVRVTVTLTNDSAIVSENGRRVRAIAVPAGTQLIVARSAAILEQVFIRARRTGLASVQIPTFALEDPAWRRAEIRWVGSDSAVMSYPAEGASVRFRVLPTGELVRYAMGTSPQLYTVRGP